MQKRTKMVTMIACFLVCMISIITAIGTTLAFYSGGGDLENNLDTKENSSVYLEEEFKPDDKWLPGETKQKKVKFGNDGKVDQVIRFKVELQWLKKDGSGWDSMVLSTTEATPVTINWNASLATDWDNTFVDSDNGWYYYKKILPPNTSEANKAVVMDSVTFKPGLSNTTSTIYPNDFSATTYRIKVIMEGVDVDAATTVAAWGKTFTKSGSTLTWSAS